MALIASGATGLVLWLWTPAILLGARDWHRLVPGAVATGILGAVVSVASGIYVPILLTWSADRYGLIGIAFTMQSWLLVFAFAVVIGAVLGAVTSELHGDRIDSIARRRPRERTG